MERIDKVIDVSASIDGTQVDYIKMHRVQSRVFDLMFPENNVYQVRSGLTRSVCDGIWLFLKPLEIGSHILHFKGTTLLTEQCTKNYMKKAEVYAQIRELIDTDLKFNLEVFYELNCH